jgi:site-specific DNA recombinase
MTVETKILRAVGYCRVSTSDQAENGKSLNDQQHTLKRWADLQGWQFVDCYIDQCSGGTDERPRLQDLLLDARNHRFDLVLTTKLDRFMRNTRLTLNSIEELKKSNVALVTMDGTDTRQGGIADIMLSMLAAMAQYERVRIAERITAARAYRKAQNQWSAGRVLFGYRFDKESKQLLVYEPEAKAVLYIFNTYVTQKIGIANLAEMMNKTDFLPPHRKNQKYDFWRGFTILHILCHHAYKGGPSDDWPYKTPAIITPELWQQAQLQRSHNFHFRPADGGKTKYQSRLLCGLCGHTLTLERNGGKRLVYACPGRKRILHPDGSPLCTLPRFEANAMDKKIDTEVYNLLHNPELLFNFLKNYAANVKADQQALALQLKPIRAEADSVREEMAICDAKLEMKRIPPDVYKTRVKVLQAKLAEIERRTDNLNPALVQATDLNVEISEHALEIADLLRKCPSMLSGKLGQESIELLLRMPQIRLKQKIVPNKIQPAPNPGDPFKFFVVFPDKVELRGNIDIAKLTNSPVPNILQQKGRKV